MATPKSFRLYPEGKTKLTENDVWNSYYKQGMQFFFKKPYSSSDYNVWLTVLLQIPGLTVKSYKDSEDVQNWGPHCIRKYEYNGFTVSYDNKDICKIYERREFGNRVRYLNGDFSLRPDGPTIYCAVIHGFVSWVDSNVCYKAENYCGNQNNIQHMYDIRMKQIKENTR